MPKTPEQWLAEAAPQKEQGIFKLFLGYAPGVGKTYNMLSEGIRRHSRGEDVAIGVVETHGRKGIAELAAKLETIPRRRMEYKGASFDEMDVDAILARRPRVVLVDEFVFYLRHQGRLDQLMIEVAEPDRHVLEALELMLLQEGDELA